MSWSGTSVPEGELGLHKKVSAAFCDANASGTEKSGG
jgi:hypothetical protein